MGFASELATQAAACFRIRDGLKRFDGTPITARNFEYALKREVDPRLTDRQNAFIIGCPITLDPSDAAAFQALTKNPKSAPQITLQGYFEDYPHPQNWLNLYISLFAVQSMDARPIGLFDSGVGGLTIWREVARGMPNEDLIYFADQAHCPYGARPPAEIRAYSFRAAEFLMQQGSKVIVVACNTASAAALDGLRGAFPKIAFVGMEPAVKPAAQTSRGHKIGVLATRGTFDGELFTHTRSRLQDVQVITQVADGLVEKIEAGEIDSAETEELLRRSVEPLRDAGVDTIVLGCTHYPFVAPLIQRIAGDSVALVDASEAVARQVRRVIEARGLQNDVAHPPVFRFYTSGDDRLFAQAIKTLIGIDAMAKKVE